MYEYKHMVVICELTATRSLQQSHVFLPLLYLILSPARLCFLPGMFYRNLDMAFPSIDSSKRPILWAGTHGLGRLAEQLWWKVIHPSQMPFHLPPLKAVMRVSVVLA